MRRSLLVLTIAWLLLRAPAHAQGLIFEAFGEYLDSLRVQAGIPGLVAAIVGPNDTLWERAYGLQDLERRVSTRPDTPFHADGLTQIVTASMVLRCVEERRLSLEDRAGQFKPDSTEPNATIRQLLTHTYGAPESLAFAYKPERLEPLWLAIGTCTGDSFRETLGNLLQRFAMRDSVPGPDVIELKAPAQGIPDASEREQYARALQRLATPYAIDVRGRATPSQYAAATLTPSSGLVTTIRDFARFDLALRQGLLIRSDTLSAAWRAPVGAGGQPLPHGLGWFVQKYNGEMVVWQLGRGDNASSAFVMTVPGRGLTLILMANSDRLVVPFALTGGDVTVSPFARLFLNLFVR